MDDLGHYVRSASTPMLVSMGAVAAATTYYLATRPKPLPSVCDFNMQSVEVPVRHWRTSNLSMSRKQF